METTFTLIVEPSGHIAAMDPEDQALLGTYEVDLRWQASHPEGVLADCVLGAFHDQNGVENVDDLELSVYTSEGKRVEVVDPSSYEGDLKDVVASDPVWVSASTKAPKAVRSAPRRRTP